MKAVSVRVSKTTFIDGAYQAILKGILSHELKPGDRLRSKQLAETLSVSRTPVERALERLAGEGLVEFRPGAGPHVMEPTVGNVVELYDLRLILELYAAARAVANPGPGFLARLRALQQEFRRESKRVEDTFETYHAAFEADKAMHLHLFSACQGTQARELYSQVSTRIMMAQFAALGPFLRLGAVAEHDRIHEAFESRSATAVAVAIRRHIEAARDAFLERARAGGLDMSRHHVPLDPDVAGQIAASMLP